MEAAMNKKTLDTYGGIGSIVSGFVCAWFAQQHHPHESIWKVWVTFCVLLILNGIAMIVHAQRTRRREADQSTGPQLPVGDLRAHASAK